ncbi:hypothetical protein BGZ89_009980 [Linnemannia elongata]|nr:hypothetical protein BGZ89_009980 [Linnemannia elongata]
MSDTEFDAEAQSTKLHAIYGHRHHEHTLSAKSTVKNWDKTTHSFLPTEKSDATTGPTPTTVTTVITAVAEAGVTVVNAQSPMWTQSSKSGPTKP